MPLPPPPRRPPATLEAPDAKRPTPKMASIDDKLSTRRSYRQARGLCIRCGNKWALGHRCAPVPQVHALQEVWDLCAAAFQEDDVFDPQEPEPEPTNQEQVFMLLSAAAVSGLASPRTMQFKGTLMG